MGTKKKPQGIRLSRLHAAARAATSARGFSTTPLTFAELAASPSFSPSASPLVQADADADAVLVVGGSNAVLDALEAVRLALSLPANTPGAIPDPALWVSFFHPPHPLPPPTIDSLMQQHAAIYSATRKVVVVLSPWDAPEVLRKPLPLAQLLALPDAAVATSTA